MIRRPPRSTLDRSSAASDVYKRQVSIAVDRQFLPAKSLDDEIRNHAAIILKHSLPISVEDPNDPRVHSVLPMIVHHQCFGYPFAFVVTASQADAIDVSPIILSLRMDQRIAVDLGSG